MTITAAGTVIEAKLVTGDLQIRAANVTIRNSRIMGEVNNDETAAFPFSLTDSEVVNGKRAACQCVGSDNFVMTRVEVTGGNRGVYCRLSCSVIDSYIHGQDLSFAQHASAVRVEQGAVITHNTLACDWTAITDSEIGCSADLTGYPDFAPIKNNTIIGNHFMANNTGTGFCAYGGATSGKPFSTDPTNATNIVFRNNVWERGPNGKCGTYGPVTDFDSARTGNVWTGNVWDDGAPVPSGG